MTTGLSVFGKDLVQLAPQRETVSTALDRTKPGVPASAASMKVLIDGMLDDVEVIEVPQFLSQG